MAAVLDAAPTPVGKLLAFVAETRNQAMRHEAQAPKTESDPASLSGQGVPQSTVATMEQQYPGIGPYYQDLRAAVKATSTVRELRSMAPVPWGVMLPSQLREPSQGETLLRNATTYDTLLIMLRMILSVGIMVDRAKDTRVFDLALHDFGVDKLADFVVKGALVELLYPDAKHNATVADVPLETLLHHPLIKTALWAHPSLQLYPNATWMRQPGSDKWAFEHLSDETLADMCMHDWDGVTPLGTHLGRLFEPRQFQGADARFTSRMPLLIAVLLDRSPTAPKAHFDDFRAFTLTAPVYPRLVAGAPVDVVPRRRHYHLCMAVSLKRGDAHLYRKSTEPVYQQPYFGDGKARRDADEKLRDAVAAWSVADGSGGRCLLFYRKIFHAREADYVPPVTGAAEFLTSKQYRELCDANVRHSEEDGLEGSV